MYVLEDKQETTLKEAKDMAKDDKGMTPMMKQFFSMKAQHPDALMLFRCGDFYETYAEDAIELQGSLVSPLHAVIMGETVGLN